MLFCCSLQYIMDQVTDAASHQLSNDVHGEPSGALFHLLVKIMLLNLGVLREVLEWQGYKKIIHGVERLKSNPDE